MKISGLIIGLIVMLVANWPSVVNNHFPANLPFAFIGSCMVGGFAASIFKRLLG